MLHNSLSRYGSVAQAFHWVIVGLVAVQVYLAIVAFRSTDDAAAADMLALHRPLGLAILTLMVVRLAWKLTNPRPATTPGLQRMSATRPSWPLRCRVRQL
ncbi:MAG: cytochrome b/b6 domain-containing protein [Gammaproteobacteria bacterium]|jgi:cytochrome b561|nr:cytochrome b/b6 domain-containing protein [Gammaproteobacteria bacterium]